MRKPKTTPDSQFRLSTDSPAKMLNDTLQMDKPKPVPFAKVLSFTKRSNTGPTASGAIPIPVSVTENSI